MDSIDTFIGILKTEPIWKCYLVSALIALLFLVILWNRLKQPSRLMAFATDRGKVYISRRAISEMISKVAARTQGVEKCRNRLQEHRGRLRIYLSIHIRADADLRDIEHKLETHIADVLNRNLGFDSIESFSTRASAIIGELAELRPVARSGLKTETELNIRRSKKSDDASGNPVAGS